MSENITFGGGMTQEDFIDGLYTIYIANSNIFQINFKNRTTAFEEGWSFSIKQGALLPYSGTSANVALDKEYKFTFGAGSGTEGGYHNMVSVTAYNTTTFSMATNQASDLGTALSGDRNYNMTIVNDTVPDKYTQLDMIADSAYDGYIDFNGVDDNASLSETGLGVKYILGKDNSTRVIQLANWDYWRSELKTGSYWAFKEGLPIYWTSGGENYKAVLDATYVYYVVGSNTSNTQVYRCFKFDSEANTYGLEPFQGRTTGTKIDGYWIAIPMSESIASFTARPNYVAQKLARKYYDFAGWTDKELADYEVKLELTENNVLQLVINGSGVNALKVGDTITLKDGLPVAYMSNGAYVGATLQGNYTITVTAKTDTTDTSVTTGGDGSVTFSMIETGTFGLTGSVSKVTQEGSAKYQNMYLNTADFADASGTFSDNFDSAMVINKYFYAERGGEAIDLTTEGWYFRYYYLTGSNQMVRYYCPEDYATFTDGDYIIWRQGLPITYTTTKGTKKTVTLEKDYGYVYNADTNTFTYDSTLGNSEVDTFKDVTIKKLGSISAFNTTSNAWDIYPIPKRPANVPGIEDVTTFEAKYEINDKEYNGTFTRSDDTNGLYLTIPAKNLAADADGVFVTIKAGEYASDGTSASINITDDYVIYVHRGALTQYEGDVYCETDSDTYIVSEADTVQIDGETYELGDEYAKSGTHVLTYTVDGCTYAKRLIIYRIGDINDDGEISATDLVAIKKRIAGKREVTMSGIEASDMDMDDAITTYDTNLLRKYLVTEQGVLVLSPREGNTVANASDAAEGLIVDYYYEKSELYKTGEDIYHRDITILKWLSFENVETYTVALATTEDMSDRVLYQTTDCSLKLMNLLKNTDYYWTVTAGEFVSPIQTFHTADTIRTITVEGVSNTRDGGGWMTEDGKVVKQGMFYRGGKLEDITDSGLTVMNEQLGIKTDMDLRNSTETDGASSPLGSSVQYVNYSGPYYWGTNGINAEAYKEALVNEIRTFANEDNYPIYVHCSLGRDRTGTICFLINALLGVSEKDLYLDYEFSLLSVTGTKDNASVHKLVAENFATMYNNVKAYAPDGTMAEATEAFMISIGVTQDEIKMIRQLLLQDS